MSRRLPSKSLSKPHNKSLRAVQSTDNITTLPTTSHTFPTALHSQRHLETVLSDPQIAEKEQKLSELSSLIRSKERTLALLTSELPTSDSTESLLSQLQARDQHIEELSQRVRDLSSQLAVAGLENFTARDKQIASLQEDKIKLFRDLQNSEEQIATMAAELREMEKNLSEERENIALVEEALNEENSALKTGIQRKDEQLKNIKIDILQLSKIIGEMSKLNTDLNEKILTLNGDMEKVNAAAYEHQARAKQTDEIEQAYNDLRNDYLSVQKREKKLTDEIARLKDLEEISVNCQEKLKKIEDELVGNRDLYTAVQSIRHELKTHTSLKSTLETDPSTLKQQLTELTESYKSLALTLKQTQIRYESAGNRIKMFESEKQKLREEYEETVERLGLRGKITADVYEKLREKVENLTDELTKADMDLQKSLTKNVILVSQIERLKEEKNAKINAESGKNKQIHDLKAQILSLRSQKVTQDSAMAAREARLRSTAAEMKSLIDDIWKKDTEILKLNKILARYRENSTENRGNAEIRTQAALQLTTNSAEMEKKEREIELFRGMLKSTQLQLKAREAEVTRLKKKYENDPVREGIAVPVAPRDLSPEKMTGKLDLDIRKIEELVDIREQVNSGGTVSMETLRKVMVTEEIPRDKRKLGEMLTGKMREMSEVLGKWANWKFRDGVQRRNFGEQVQSVTVRELLREGSSVSVTDLLTRLRDMIEASSKPRRK